MVKFARRCMAAFGFALLGVASLQARDSAAWRVGDMADQDIAAPVPLDVIDAAATAERKAEAALQTSAIFRVNSSITNVMVLKATAALAEAHANFVAAIQRTFAQPSLDESALLSPGFTNFLAAFNGQNKKFPLPAALARQWARGESDLNLQTDLVRQLLQTTRRPIRPDSLPDGFEVGSQLRLVPVHSSRDTLTLDQAEERGTLIPSSSLTTVTRVRGLFRRDFPPEDQAAARAWSLLLHPNCELDTNLTRQARDRAASQIVVAYHFDAGQLIVQRGQTVDARIQAALTRLNEISPLTQAGPQSSSRPTAKNSELNSPAGNFWRVAVFAGIPLVVLLVLWWVRTSRRPVALVPVRAADLPPELAPQLAQLLKSAVVQELAAQRHELLQTQQTAAAEVVRLMQRLNELQAPLQERLGTYERRILELETELSVRTEENRELLKMKIDLLRQQIEAERCTNRVEFN